MTTKSTDSASRLTAKEYTAIHTKTPMSGTDWLDSMITAARELDAEAFEAKLKEPTKATKPKAPRKEPEMRDQKD